VDHEVLDNQRSELDDAMGNQSARTGALYRRAMDDCWKNGGVPLAAPSPATLRVGDLSHVVGEVY
jgi:hypothetical protein